MQRGARRYRGLEQGRIEVLDRPTVARRALGEYHYPVSARHDRAHDLVEPSGVAAPRTLDEERSRALAQQPYERPAPDLGLRYEACRAHLVDDEDVQPRDVIGYEERRVGTI
jgi:hypothetical protein